MEPQALIQAVASRMQSPLESMRYSTPWTGFVGGIRVAEYLCTRCWGSSVQCTNQPAEYNGLVLITFGRKIDPMNSPTEIVEAINAAWRSGNMEALTSLFHPHIAIVGPAYQPLAKGIAACVASYQDFLRVSVIHDYHQTKLTAHDYGDVAIVTFGWEMDYEQGGKRSRETGTDLFVLKRSSERWQAVWRAVTFDPAD